MTAPARNPTEKALRELSKLGDAVFQRALRLGRGAAARIARDAAKNSSEFTSRSGGLAKEIKVSNTKKGTRLVSNAPHSYVVERGHGGPQPAPPHPFLEGGARSTTDRQLQAAGKAIDRELRKLHKP